MEHSIDSKPFVGLKVVDLSSILAGPLTGSFFAELGADVVKIENLLSGGDATRQWKLPSEDKESPYSAYYFSANFGKQTHKVDLTAAEGVSFLEGHLADADILLSNYQKSVATKLGILPSELLERYPHLIIAQLSAYDFDDTRAGYDLVMQGETGWISMTGTDGDHLAKLPVALIDIIASHQMKEAILIALWKKQKTNIGSIVHVSLYKSALSALANQASNYLMTGHVPKPIGTLHPNIAPYGDIFTDKDGKKFILAIGSDAQFKKLWDTLIFSTEEYHNFESNSERLLKRSALVDVLQQKFKTLALSFITTQLQLMKIPYCEILPLDKVLLSADAASMINEEMVDGVLAKSMSSIGFAIYE